MQRKEDTKFYLVNRMGIIDFNETFFAQILNTIVMFLIIRKLLYNPVKNFMAERTNMIENSIKEAEIREKEALELSKRSIAEMEKINSQRADIMSKARENAELLANDIIKEANIEASAIKERAKKESEQEKEMAMLNFKNEISSIAVLLASKIIEKEIDAQKHQDMIDSFIEKVGVQQWEK